MINEVSDFFKIRFYLSDPQHGVVVSQTALTFLEIGLNQIGRIAKIMVTVTIVFD